MNNEIVAQLTIIRQGSVNLVRTTDAVTRSASKVDFYYENMKGVPTKSGSVAYAPFTGLDHDVTIETSHCHQVLPVTKETWNFWMGTTPSFAELQNYGKGRNTQTREFKRSHEVKKAISHASDIVADILNEAPIHGVNFRLTLLQA